MTRKLVITLAALVFLLVLAFVLNPSPERHRAKLKETIAQRSPLAGALGVGQLAAFASNYHSYGVASTTTVGERTMTFGTMGMVFVAD
ncbi:hypothetical protein [Ramlibacter albus]|uniref:Uncharacterized protein n=1 Tax=Ramlibacter albus TaxID=2079448 RepID=A0A923MDH4_9BURK|nr:hypothetical protein [Ramlibacter albus]MBC5768151.1 hypothetical protein [Ramlibacter albus]